MASRHFPVRPNLDQLKHQAKDLLRALRRNEPQAIAVFREHFAENADPTSVKLADAQFVLARSYGLPHWPRLVAACQMTDAIWRGDVEAVRALVLRDPRLLDEDARGVKGNWGPPCPTPLISARMPSSKCCARLVPRICSMHSDAPVCRVRWIPHAGCTT